MPAGIPSETRLLRAIVLELLIQTIVHSKMGRPESSKVLMPIGGSSKLGVPVGVAVAEAVGVVVNVCVAAATFVEVLVGMLVGVFVAILVGVYVGVSVGVFVAAVVGVLVDVFVDVSVGVSVGLLVAVFAGVSVGVLVDVLVGVSVGVLVAVCVGVSVGVEVGATTVTVFELVLFVSLPSVTLLFGSTVTVLARLPAAVGVTVKVMLNEAAAGRVTTPFATQLRAVPAIEQLIVPVGGVLPFVTVTGPGV